MPRKLHPKSKVVAHSLPHRTRLRIPRAHRNAETIKKVHDTISKTEGVQSVEINERTGSVLIHHEENPEILGKVGESLEEVAGELFEAILEAEGIEIPGLSIFAHVIRQSLSKADDKVSIATKNFIDLKMMVPVGLFAAGVFQARRSLGWLEATPAWVLFYLAYDAYMKFHGPGVTGSSEQLIEVQDVTDAGKALQEGKALQQSKPLKETKPLKHLEVQKDHKANQ